MELKLRSISYWFCRSALLIVPYGIETKDTYDEDIRIKSFNRTLWN